MYVRTISSLVLAVGLMASTAGVHAAQKFDQITVLGFTITVPHIASRRGIAECKVNMIREDGRTYCFGSGKALDAFANDAPTNIENDKETYAFRGA